MYIISKTKVNQAGFSIILAKKHFLNSFTPCTGLRFAAPGMRFMVKNTVKKSSDEELLEAGIFEYAPSGCLILAHT